SKGPPLSSSFAAFQKSPDRPEYAPVLFFRPDGHPDRPRHPERFPGADDISPAKQKPANFLTIALKID
ncbi:hypothetical protein AAAB33_13590, partial [Lentilactobacillus buchneri]|uniref:hypothetical protein n=1 Tax=Lentilactobacillus buchneri TaxID=1581 RepID=UPI0030F1F8A6